MKMADPMKKTIKISAVLLLTPIFVACSDGPSSSEVETLIKAQYTQVDSLMESAMGDVGDSELASAMSSMLSGMMPKLESVKNVSCNESDAKDTYLCTADITQKLGAESQSDTASFMVVKVNDEWVLRN